jgi:hypothetical protein
MKCAWQVYLKKLSSSFLVLSVKKANLQVHDIFDFNRWPE